MSRGWKIVVGIFIVLFAARVAAPPILLNQLNKKLANFSPIYKIHIGDLDLSLMRMAYRLERATISFRSNDHVFLKANAIDVGIAWSELLHGRILASVEANNVVADLTHELLEKTKSTKESSKQDAKAAVETLFPVKVSRVTLNDGAIQFGDFLGAPEDPRWRISTIQGSLANLMPGPKAPYTFFTLQGRIMESSTLKSAGRAKRDKDPVEWEVDAEIHDFDLKQSNELMRKYVPLTFTKGTLDLFAEAKSTDGHITGYVKPFFKEMFVIGNAKDFKNLKHFAVEIVAAIGNFILRREATQTVATEIDFYEENGKFKVDTGKALKKAIQHGFDRPLSKAVEEKVNLD